MTGLSRRVKDCSEIRRVGGARFRRGSAVPATVRIRERRHVDVLGPAAAARTVELVRADVDEATGVPVVRPLEDGHIAPAGRGPGQPESQLVRLTPRVDEVRHLERRREGRDQAIGVVEDGRVEVAGVGLEQRLLPGRRLDDAWMGVPDMRDVVHEVQVGAAVGVVEVRPAPRTIVSGDR